MNRCAPIWLALMFLIAAGERAWSQAKPAADVKPAAEPPLLFRREYLPKSLLTREKQKLVPIPRKEFDQWLEKAQARAAQSLPEAWVEAIELRAAQHGNTLLGQARLQVRRRRRAGSEPTLLPLTGLKLPVMRPSWEATKSPAVVGMTAEGLLMAVIDRSDTLTFDWQLSGRQDPFRAENFDLSLAEASRCRVLLTLPAGTRLESSTGIVERQLSEDDSLEQWSVQLGAANEVRLRCISADATIAGPLVLVREENTCTVGQGELEAQCQLRLDVYREPLERMEVELVGDWSPTGIRLGDTQVPFVLSGDGRNAVLQFEPPLVGLNRRLTFTGRAGVQMSQPTVAPRVRVKDAAWLEGALAVEGSAVELRNWELTGLDPIRSEPMAMPGASRRWALQSDRASAAFVVGRLPSVVRAETGSTIRLDVEAATASVVADFTAENAGAFELVADVAPGWIIDSLETVPSQVLENWGVEPQGSRQLLQIALRRSISPSQRVRVMIEAHRPAPAAAENVGGEQLRPVRWHAESQGYLALGIDPLWQLEFGGSERTQAVDPGQLTNAQSERLSIAEDVVLYADDATFDHARLELAAESPQFTAQWELRVGSDGNRFSQQTTLRVEPTATPVERLHVLIRPSAGKSLQWQMQGEDNTALEARLVRGSDVPDGEDEWELTLARGRRNPFTLSAACESEAKGSFAARFFRCVEASVQPGRLVLAAESNSRLAVEQASGLERLWNGDENARSVAQWSFDPSQSAALTVRLATAQELRQLLLIQDADLETRLTRQYMLYTVDYTVLNQQAQPLDVRLPPQHELEQVLVDGLRVDPRVSAGKQLSIPLPSKSGSFHVQIAYRMPRPSTGATIVVESAWPEVAAPAAGRRWHVIFSDDYRLLTWSSPSSWTWTALWERMRAPLPGFEPPPPASMPDTPLACSRLDFDSATRLPASIRLIEGNAVGSLSWLLLAACWGVVAGRRLWTGRQLLGLTGLIGLVALCLPTSFDPAGRMLLLGCAAGLLTRRLKRLSDPSTEPQPGRQFSPATVGLVVAIVASAALAQRVVAQDRKPIDIIYRVIFPVDESGKPVDDYVYTSEPFYKDLYRRAHQPAVVGPAVLFVEAEYRARPQSDTLAWETIDANLSIEMLQAGPINVPWPHEGFLIPPERIRLDGRSAPITWDAAGTAFSVNVETTGRHTLQFVAQPTRRDDGQLPLMLPPTATARLMLDTLDDAAQVQAWPGPLPVSFTGEDGVQTLELGPRREVTLITRPLDAPAAKIRAEQLLWANLWRGGGIVEGRWRFQATSGVLAEAVVDVGEGLELVSAAALSPAAVRWQPDNERGRMVWTPRTPTEELVVEAVFLWRQSSEERVLPRIEPRDAEVTRRWVAADPRGNVDMELAPMEEEIDVGGFAALWNAETWPLAAQSFMQPGPQLLGTLNVSGALAYDARTRCEISAKSTAFYFQAQIKSVDGSPSLLRVTIPPEATITSADVGVAGQFRGVPWLPLAGNQIALLPSESLRGGNVLRIRGELPGGAKEQAFRPPLIVNGQELSHGVDIIRRSDVLVTLASHDGFNAASSAIESTAAIAVASLELDESSTRELRWKIETNQPRIVGIFVTTLRPDGKQWIARVDAFLAVRDGVVDAFHLESSGGWNGSKLVTGDAALQVKDAAGTTKELVLRPRGATSNRYHLALEALVSGQRIAAPSFRLLGAENVQQYVRLPENDGFSWSTSGLQEAPLPAAASAVPDGNNLLIYRVAVPQFHAELLANKPSAATPRVAWGSLHVSTRDDGSFVARAEAMVDPAGSAELPVSIPQHTQLVQCSVEGEAMLAELKGQRRFSIPLRSNALPQMVRIVYAGERLPQGELSELVPRFDPWIVDQRFQLTKNAQTPTPPNLRELVQMLSGVLAEPPQPDEELASWASRWLVRLKAAQERSGDNPQALAVLQRLESMAGPETVAAEIPETPNPETAVEPLTTSTVSISIWLTAMLTWVGLVVGGYSASRSALLQELMRRWPSAAAALVALAIAVAVSPWVGGMLLAIAGASSLTWPWQRPNAR